MVTHRPRAPKVWILNQYADSPDRPSGTRHFSLARAVVRQGGEATIVAAGFDHVVGREIRIRPGRALSRGDFDGVRFVWLRTIAYRGNGPRRMLNMLSYALMAVLADLGRDRPDVVVGSTVHPFAAAAGWFIARRRGVRFVYEIRDLWPQTLIDLGAMAPTSVMARLLYGLESFLTRRADAVIALLPGVASYLRERGLPAEHVHYLPNGADFEMTDADLEDLAPNEPLATALRRIESLRRDGEAQFAYVGAHGRVNSLDVIMRATQEAQRSGAQPFRLWLVGDGPEKPGLRRLAEQMSLTNVEFLDPIPKAQVPRFLAAIDAGIVHATYTPVYRFGISFNKVFDYMAASLPIVFACTAVNDPIAASGGGLSVAPDDPVALGHALAKLASMSQDERRAMGRCGRDFVEREHDMRAIGDRFVDLVRFSH